MIPLVLPEITPKYKTKNSPDQHWFGATTLYYKFQHQCWLYILMSNALLEITHTSLFTWKRRECYLSVMPLLISNKCNVFHKFPLTQNEKKLNSNWILKTVFLFPFWEVGGSGLTLLLLLKNHSWLLGGLYQITGIEPATDHVQGQHLPGFNIALDPKHNLKRYLPFCLNLLTYLALSVSVLYSLSLCLHLYLLIWTNTGKCRELIFNCFM